MRILKRIPHDRYLIELHQYNQKLILKIALDNYEQSFKLPESEIDGIRDLENLVSSTDFLRTCLQRFISMREDFTTSFKSIKNED